MSKSLNRVFLFCVPRTMSTALLKCLSFVEGIQVVNEPYECAYFVGPEKKLQEKDPKKLNRFEERFNEIVDPSLIPEGTEGYDEKICTYDWIREKLLEASYQDKRILICKDMAYHLDARYHMLPKGFKYSFLIRHPAKVLLSWKKALINLFGDDFVLQPDELLLQLPKTIYPHGNGFKELYEFVEYVEMNLHQEAVIIDADDLLSDPAGILSAYCHKMGIPYSAELLSWEAGNSITNTWISSKGMANANEQFYEVAFKSCNFKAPTPVPEFETLPPDVQVCVSASMEYYEKLYQKRTKSS